MTVFPLHLSVPPPPPGGSGARAVRAICTLRAWVWLIGVIAILILANALWNAGWKFHYHLIIAEKDLLLHNSKKKFIMKKFENKIRYLFYLFICHLSLRGNKNGLTMRKLVFLMCYSFTLFTVNCENNSKSIILMVTLIPLISLKNKHIELL